MTKRDNTNPLEEPMSYGANVSYVSLRKKLLCFQNLSSFVKTVLKCCANAKVQKSAKQRNLTPI